MKPLNTAPSGSLRIDRWLFFTRFFKTRMLASGAVTGGHVRLGGERAAPGNRVQIGDTIELVKDRLPYRITVLAIPSRRGPAKEAAACYEDDAVVANERAALRDGIRQDRMLMPRTDGRPDKHTRRRLRQRSRGGGESQ